MTSKRKRNDPRNDLRSNFGETFRKGIRGERIAALLLMCKGYRILARRLRVGGGGRGGGGGLGEIDLLAQRGRTLVVVEVKWRADRKIAAYALDSAQQRRLRRAGEVVFMRLTRARSLETLRFDVVLMAPFSIRHLENAF